MPEEPQYTLTAKEAAAIINNGITADALERAAQRGRIPAAGAKKTGGRRYFNEEWIRKFARGEVTYVKIRK
jgi:hypothetical protein